MMNKTVLLSGAILAFFGLIGTALVAITELTTRDQIAENERQALLRQLYALVPAKEIDNDFLAHPLTLSAPDYLGEEKTLAYVGTMDSKLVAVVLEATIPNGYAGPMFILVAVDGSGVLKGVRVVSHNETPGLGDKIELEKSDWILGFTGKSLTDPVESRWKVKKDGGDFDQFTGATITPRAIVNSVKQVLYYFNDNKTKLFQQYLQKSGAKS